MLVKDARTAIRVRTDSQPSLVLHGWLESPHGLCQPLSKTGLVGWSLTTTQASFSTFQIHTPFKVSFYPHLLLPSCPPRFLYRPLYLLDSSRSQDFAKL